MEEERIYRKRISRINLKNKKRFELDSENGGIISIILNKKPKKKRTKEETIMEAFIYGFRRKKNSK